ncbi:hypothetical protein H0H81_004919 [Sphagnurus paluster]|uniref:Uncharacterized protein n=1 Tax=Sphagnurus paluster TaxID=117069 RepID=A0A9P7FZJ3_9AGAR|nr:hypothetical protein H0H81_004919 [Sphagnurus paluster]
MTFQTRNPYYLRISEKNVLPLYLYLDERHLGWMSDMVLQHVLADLRPHILPKLKTETNMILGNTAPSKKGMVDTHRGETYQFCYFFRKAEPHSVVVKARNFVALPSKKRPEMPPPPLPSSSKSGKRKAKSVVEGGSAEVVRKKRKTKGKGKARDERDISTSSHDEGGENTNPAPRRSQRQTKIHPGGYNELDDINDSTTDATGATDIDRIDPIHSHNPSISGQGALNDMDVDAIPQPKNTPALSMATLELEVEEEEKPKLGLQLKYQGFGIYGHCLCVVVEPWPPMRSVSRTPSVAPFLDRGQSVGSTNPVPSGVSSFVREKTPLFLPDDWRGRSETPEVQYIPPTRSSFFDPRFLEDSESEDEDGGMILFSQVLNSAGDRAGAAEDDESMDTGMFFGDADEVREL